MSVLHPPPLLGDTGGGQGRTGEDRGGIFRHSHSIEAIPSESKYTGIPREFLLKQSLSECGGEYLSVLLQLYLLNTTPYPPLYNPFLFLPILLLLLLPFIPSSPPCHLHQPLLLLLLLILLLALLQLNFLFIPSPTSFTNSFPSFFSSRFT